jgi:hypothetical protein
MEVTAALIEFPEPSALSLIGIAVVLASITFALFENDYFKKATLQKTVNKIQHKAVLDIYEDKKLDDSETELLDRIIDQHAHENPLRAVTTRDGFGQCVQVEMHRIATESDKDIFRETGIKLRDIRNTLGLDYVPIGKPVHSSRELHVSQIISVAQDNGSNSSWKPMVLQEIDEAYLYISRKSDSTIARFEDCDKVLCKLWHDEDAQYVFLSRIVFHGEARAEWRLSHNEQKMDRTQSREHFRMRYEQNTNVEILNASANEEPEYIKRRRAVTREEQDLISRFLRKRQQETILPYTP